VSDASDSPMSNYVLGELFLIANDHMHIEEDDDVQGTLTSFAKLATTVLPVQEAVNGNVRHKVMRSYQMIKLASSLHCNEALFRSRSAFQTGCGLRAVSIFRVYPQRNKPLPPLRSREVYG
jgi:hypothetical protein